MLRRITLRVVLLATLLGCGRIDYDPRFDAAQPSRSDASADGEGGFVEGGSDGALLPDSGPPPDSLVVEPTYPLHAAWNAYVARTNPALDPDAQPDIDCAPLDPVDGVPCIHAGERRRVETSRASCDGLSLEDNVGAFTWRCDVRSGRATFFSQRLVRGRSLRDLLNEGGSGFRLMHVTLFEGTSASETSAPSIWWANPVRAIPNGGGILTNDTPSLGTVFVATANTTVSGIELGENHVAITALPGATISFDPIAPLNCAAIAGGAIDSRCIVFAEDRSFLWIEGSFQGLRTISTLRGLLLRDIRNSRLTRLNVRDTGSHGLDLQEVYETRLDDLHQQNSAATGLYLRRSRYNHFLRIRMMRNFGNGLHLHGDSSTVPTTHNVFHDVRASNATSGIYNDCGTRDNVFTNVVVTSNTGYGIASPCNTNTTYSHITAVGDTVAGIEVHRGSQMTVLQAVMSRNGSGFRVESGSGRYAQLVATDNSGVGIATAANGGIFSGALIVGNNVGGDCSITDPYTSAGVIPGTCTVSGTDGSSDYGGQMSTAILRTGRTVANAFEGRVAIDDAINDSDVDGFAATVTNWALFENTYRAWGRDGATFTAGHCASNCRIWDWRIASTPNPLRNTVGDGVTVEPAQAGSPCPSWLRGEVAMTDFVRAEILGDGAGDDDGLCEGAEPCHPANTFLMNALEIMEDDVGDDDGLCESGETCVASPHFGAFQGDGEPVASCTFDPGSGPVSSVTMLVR